MLVIPPVPRETLWLFLVGLVLMVLALIIEHQPRTTPSRVTPWMVYPGMGLLIMGCAITVASVAP